MATMKRNLICVGFLGTLLAGCGSSDSPAPPPPVVVAPPTARVEDQFGANFGVAYRADPNSIARDPVAGDIIPLSLTTGAVPL